MMPRIAQIVMIVALLVNSFGLGGCTNEENFTNTSPPEPAPPYTLELSFPNGAPALNKVTEFKVVAMNKTSVMNDVRIDLILPEGFELISGNLTWSANSLPHGDTEVINAVIKAKKIGWTIEARLNAEDPGPGSGLPEGGARYPIYVAVSEDSAEWDVVRPWLKEHGSPDENNIGDLPEPPAIPVPPVEDPSAPIEE